MTRLATLETRDGVRRLYKVPWPEVGAELPAYGERVRARIAQHGESHPFIRTECALEVLDGEGGLFPPQRIVQLQGDHPRCHRAEAGKRYAGLLDVAGEEEKGSGPEAFDSTSRRDSTALTIVGVETEGVSCHSIAWSIAWPGRGRSIRRYTRNWWTWRAPSGSSQRWWWTPPGWGPGWRRFWRTS
jgi:hypothetical protein